MEQQQRNEKKPDDEMTDAELLRELEQDNISPQQLLRLKRSHALDPSRFPQEKLNQMRSDLMEAEYKPVIFEPRKRYRIHEKRLFRQFEKHKPPGDLLHNFKRDSKPHRMLFEWSPLDIVRNLLGVVHHEIYSVGRAGQSKRPYPPSPLETQQDLQNALIHSHWTHYTQCACAPMVYRLEVLLHAALQRIFIQGTRAIFVMQWSEAQRFSLAICMTLKQNPASISVAVPITEKKKKKTMVEEMEVEEKRSKDSSSENHIVEFSRTDLYNELRIDETLGEQAQLRALIRDGMPSYVYCAFIRRDDGEAVIH